MVVLEMIVLEMIVLEMIDDNYKETESGRKEIILEVATPNYHLSTIHYHLSTIHYHL